MKVVYILLAAAVLKCIWLYKIYGSVPASELKRRARDGDKRAARLYKTAAYGDTLYAVLWAAGTAAMAVLVIWSARTAWWLAAIAVVISAWLVFLVNINAGGWAGRLAALAAPYTAWFLGLVQPVAAPAAALFGRRGRPAHTGLYEKKDLLDLLNRQNRQAGNRIDEHDLKIAFNAISFGNKSVGSVMVPRHKARLVSTDETVGPMLMDELHKTGETCFAAVKGSAKSASPKAVGALYLADIVGDQGGGKVKEFIRKHVYYVNEDAALSQALAAFLKTGSHLLLVVNNFEEIAGVLTLESALTQILGKPPQAEAEDFASPGAAKTAG